MTFWGIQSAQKTSWQADVNKASWLVNHFATRSNREKFHLNQTLYPQSKTTTPPFVYGWKEIQAHHGCILSILLKSTEQRRWSINRLFCPYSRPCFSFSFLQAAVDWRAASATGSRECFREWKMSYRGDIPTPSSLDPTHSPPWCDTWPLRVFISERGSEK